MYPQVLRSMALATDADQHGLRHIRHHTMRRDPSLNAIARSKDQCQEHFNGTRAEVREQPHENLNPMQLSENYCLFKIINIVLVKQADVFATADPLHSMTERLQPIDFTPNKSVRDSRVQVDKVTDIQQCPLEKFNKS